jgi:hypothetical protein
MSLYFHTLCGCESVACSSPARFSTHGVTKISTAATNSIAMRTIWSSIIRKATATMTTALIAGIPYRKSGFKSRFCCSAILPEDRFLSTKIVAHLFHRQQRAQRSVLHTERGDVNNRSGSSGTESVCSSECGCIGPKATRMTQPTDSQPNRWQIRRRGADLGSRSHPVGSASRPAINTIGIMNQITYHSVLSIRTTHVPIP